jgi:hypothetical protein
MFGRESTQAGGQPTVSLSGSSKQAYEKVLDRFNPESISNQKSVGFNRSCAAKNLALSAHWNY